MKIFKKLVIIWVAATLFWSCGSNTGKEVNLTINLKLPHNYQKAFFLQSSDPQVVEEFAKIIKFARIQVEGKDIDPPIVRVVPFGYTMDVVVPSGKDRFFTIVLMDKNKNVIFAGAKLVPYVPAGKEISIDIDLNFARSFTDSVNDFYPAGTTGFKLFDLRDVSVLWGTQPEGKDVVTFAFTFNRNLSLYKGENSNGLMGLIEVDIDRNPSTGVPSLVDSIRPTSLGKIGVDYLLYIEGFSGSKALLLNVKSGDTKYVPVKIIDHHILITVPAEFFEIAEIATSYFYVDAAFITYLGDREFVDVFPDNGAAVSTDLSTLFLGKDFFANINRFVIKQSLPLPPNTYLEFLPFHLRNIYGGLYVLSYTNDNTSEVKVIVKDLLRNKEYVRNLGTYQVGYLYPAILARKNIVVATISAYGLPGCSNSEGYIGLISFDGGYTFKEFDRECYVEGYVEPLIFDQTLLITYRTYGLRTISVKKFHIYPDHLGSPEVVEIDQSGIESPVYFTVDDSLYQAGISITTNRVSMKLFRIGSRIPEYEFPVTTIEASAGSIGGEIYRTWTFGNRVYLSVMVWSSIKSYSLLYELIFGDDGVEKVNKIPFPENSYLDDVVMFDNTPVFFATGYSKDPDSGEVLSSLYIMTGGKKVYIARTRNSSEYLLYMGAWIIPPATPVVFFVSQLQSGSYFNIGVGLP